MLITEINIKFKAGNGGNGRVSFYKKQRGPDGGSGGDGGNIFISATTDVYALKELAKTKSIEAENGLPGATNKKQGRNGKDTEIKLPLGCEVINLRTKKEWEIKSLQDKFLICRGGVGGRGNWELRSSTNITPKQAEKGTQGEEKKLFINLKLIADIGLIGLPNSGKSSLLKELTSAKPKIGNYPFTTLEPNLGELNKKIIADIPGLIENASKGKGLGIKFLKHIERVKLLLHCISCESSDLKKDYEIIRNELRAYNDKLLKIPEIILLTKTDLVNDRKIKSYLKTLKKFGKKVKAVSIHNWEAINQLKQTLF